MRTLCCSLLRPRQACLALVLAVLALGSGSALADDLENFFRRAIVGDVTPAMFHDQGRFITTMGKEIIVMSKAELMQVYQKMKGSGAKTEIVSLKLQGRTESSDRTSVVLKATVRTTMGSTKSESEMESHEILLKDNGKYVSVFSLAKQ